ncbi:C-CAP/cofactor C-like domain-containing protein [Actinidia rufa]|uniref:C-CAP/cofactor C-like domain-containing protein n=1 Tax=Actinidia rufa TaxID=165716 RepID=A0A7J0E1H2_9ERIC|nr:C-CAP/cofactor C-like domain-containing protein [Actinidia rufa]
MEEEPEDLPNPNQTSEKNLTPPLASTPPCSSASPTENNLSLLASLPPPPTPLVRVHSLLPLSLLPIQALHRLRSRSLRVQIGPRPGLDLDLRPRKARRREFLLLAFIREIVPKKKFGFKNKKASTGVVPEIEPEIQAFEPEKLSYPISESPGFREKENEVLVKEFEPLRNCKVYVGSVFGSVLIEDVEGCVFVLASHQIRVHHARWNDFYLRARSRPIIEDGNAVRFAPYCLSYDGIEGDLREANLDEETGKWANVDDFRWLRAVQSPNWSVLPENELVGEVTIWNLDE